MAAIALENVSKVYADGTRAVSELDLAIQDGELMVFVGPSGCGKTSALRMIAGLEEITDGTIRIGDELVNDLPPKDRDVAMIFQNYALYPHMNSYDNMAFALKMRGIDKPEIDRRVRDAARVLGLEDVLTKKPRTLSGGQRQRVAMGRAIVREPQAFLMDEPLSNLDAKLRVQMRAEIARIQRALSVTTIYVTHDQSEAMTLGDRVAVMRKGELQQLDTPQSLYRTPVNLFVAEFIGSPAMNLVEAEIGGGKVRFGAHTLSLDGRQRPRRLRGPQGRARDPAGGPGGRRALRGARRQPAARHRRPARGHGRGDLPSLLGRRPARRDRGRQGGRRDRGRGVALEPQVESGTPFIARVGRESRAREGDRIEVAVDTRMLHFFDLETGAAIAE